MLGISIVAATTPITAPAVIVDINLLCISAHPFFIYLLSIGCAFLRELIIFLK
jgi:hypothetical protein